MAKYRKSLEKLHVPKKFGFFDYLALAVLVCLLIYALIVSDTIDLRAKFNEPSEKFFKEDVSAYAELISADGGDLSCNIKM